MKHPFGKGLESLIPKKSEKDIKKPKEKTEAVFYIEIEKIKPNPYQPRKEFDQVGLQALADSIREHGILQPLIASRIVEESGNTLYQLVAGERRLLAAKIVGLTQVPVIIREPTEQGKLEISLIENAQRLDLNPIEKAEAYKRLQTEFNFLQKDIARLAGKSREAVANTVRLLDLPEEIKLALKEEKISEGHARAILLAKDPQKQKTIFAKVLRDGLSVREVEDLSQKLNVWKPIAMAKIPLHFHEELKNLEEKFRSAFDMKDIHLRITAGKPKLVIFFASKKEIENLLKKIKLS